MKKKLCSILLALTMVLTLLPVSALAHDGAEVAPQATETISAFTISEDGTVYDGAGKVLENGVLNVTANNVTVKNLTFGDGASLKVETAGNFTLTDCTFNGKTYVRTPVTLNVGSATVTSNTFNGTQADGKPSYYNAIEFAVSTGNKLSSATLSNNTFEAAISNNYFSTYYYTDTATITVENNSIKLANRGSNAIRISNVTNSNVTFNLNNNSYTFVDNTSDYEGFILLQDFTKKSGNPEDFSKVTINISNLTSPSDASRLFYVWEDSVGLVSDNNPVIKGDSSIEKFFVAKVGTTMYSSLSAAVAAAADGATIKLAADLDLADTLIVTKKLTLDLEGHTIYNSKDIWNDADGVKHWSLISVRDNGDLTITGNGKLKTKENDCYAVDLYDTTAKCTIENGEYVGNISVVYVFEGQLTIKDGSFSIQQLNTNGVQDGYNLLLNCRDENYKNGTASITVTGGTYIKFNPKDCTAEGKGTSFVPDGYCAKHDETADTYTIAAHTWDAGVVTTQPTYTETGVKTYTCTNCGATKTEAIDKLVYVPVTPGNTSSSTTKNPDGSTTTTTTDKTTGTVTETTKNPDGSTTTVETRKDGSVTETNKTAGGSVGTVKSDANGNTEISANISAADVSAAAKKNEPVAAPVSVAPAASPAAAPVIKLSVPASAGEVSVVIPVTNAQQGTVAIKVNPDGTEEIIKTSVVTKDGVVLGVKGSTQIKIVNNDKDFADTVGHWAESDVDFVSARELFTGTAPQTFSPESATTRGMVVTVLARLAGESTDGGANWYDKGCAWAVTNGVSDGTDPNGTVTREQLAAMLYRYFGSPAVSGSLSFADASSVSEYAHDAMQWCVNNGIINGMDGLLNPQGQATRAQVSAMFARYIHLAATK